MHLIAEVYKPNIYLPSKTTRTTNSMNVKLSIVWKVIVDHQRNLKRKMTAA
jgi:hypothetical protein